MTISWKGAALLVISLSMGVLAVMVLRLSSIDRGMRALRRAYAQRRSLEARLSGRFPYAPYRPLRGGKDREQVNEPLAAHAGALFAERVITSHSRRARQALARFYLINREFDRAERELKKLLDIDPHQAEVHNDLGVLFLERERYAEALRHFERALELDGQFVEALFNRALCEQKMMLLETARKDWERYLRVEKISQWREEASRYIEDLESAVRLDRAERQKRIRDEFLLAYRQRDRAKAEQLVSENADVITLLAIYETIPAYLSQRERGEDGAAQEMLDLSRYIGDLMATLKHDRAIAEAIRFYQALPRSRWKVHLTAHQAFQRGRDLLSQGAYDEAARTLRHAALVLGRLGDPLYAERAELFYGMALYVQTDYMGCIELLSQLWPRLRGRQHVEHEILALSLLGKAYAYVGFYSASLDALGRALERERQSRVYGEVADLLNSVGIDQISLGQYRQAIETFSQALAAGYSETRPLLLDAIYQNIAVAYLELDDAFLAAKYQNEVLLRKERASHPHPYYFSNTLTSTADVYLRLGEYERARQYIERAQEMNESILDDDERRDADMFTSMCLARLYRLSGEPEKAAQILDRYGEPLEGRREYLLDFVLESARTHQALHQYERARREYERGVQLLEQNRAWLDRERERSFFLARGRDVYDELVLLLYDHLGQVEAAFEYAERAKARSFLDLVSTEIRLLGGREQPEIRILGSTRPRRYEEIIAALPDDVALLQYAVTRKKVILWLINRQLPLVSVDVSVPANVLRRKVEQFVMAIKSLAPMERIRAQASELYTILIEPLAMRLNPEQALCIIPDGVLHYLPFAALICPDTGRYLIQDYRLMICPSASIFLHCEELSRSKPPSRSKLLAVGDPRVDGRWEWPSLPFARREIDEIARYYPVSVRLSGHRADEQRVRELMGRYDVVHLATHFLLREREPMFSAIVLAPDPSSRIGDRESARANHRSPRISRISDDEPRKRKTWVPGMRERDGLFHVFELYDLHLHRTSLIVLSACQSGLGGFLAGEGLIGVARPFIRAGVPSLVVSLWAIPDSGTTVTLMTEFHRRWRAGVQAVAALREAQLTLLSGPQTTRHPYYWSAFLVIGSGR